jgi:FMN phosphatase YigB (HAD superfamily)
LIKCFSPKTKDILASAKEESSYMILMTQGVKSAQKRKVEATGIKKYFDEIFYVSSKKAEHPLLKKLAKSPEKIVLINDKPKEVIEMKKVIGKNAEIFLVDSPWARQQKHNLKIHKDIRSLKILLKT